MDRVKKEYDNFGFRNARTHHQFVCDLREMNKSNATPTHLLMNLKKNHCLVIKDRLHYDLLNFRCQRWTRNMPKASYFFRIFQCMEKIGLNVSLRISFEYLPIVAMFPKNIHFWTNSQDLINIQEHTQKRRVDIQIIQRMKAKK